MLYSLNSVYYAEILDHILPKFSNYTHGPRYLTTLLVKYFNDYLDIQGCGRGGGWVTCFKVGDVFSYVLDITYANSRQKISLDTSWGMS